MDESLNQPFEVKNFEGGITDFFLQAPSSYYEKADNFVVNNDLKLEVRYGSYLYDWQNSNYILDPTDPKRVTGFLLFNEESELFAQSGRDIYYRNPGWGKLTGPTGNEVYSEGGPYSISSYFNWNGHIITTNTGASKPVKIFRDEAGALQVRTNGLPQAKSPEDEEATTTLSECIAMANDLKAKMLLHFMDAQMNSGVNTWSILVPMPAPMSPDPLHAVADHAAASYLAAQAPGFQPPLSGSTPTPAPDATDLASLFVLVGALCKAHKLHVSDAIYPIGQTPSLVSTGAIHAFARSGLFKIPPGPNIPMSTTSDPEKLEDARQRLNLLAKYWEWHRLAAGTHAWDNYFALRQLYPPVFQYSRLNRYPLLNLVVPDRGLDGSPVLTPDYSHFISYVTAIKYLTNGHLSNGKYLSRDVITAPYGSTGSYLLNSAPHSRNMGTTLYENSTAVTFSLAYVDLPDPLTFEQACLTLFWCCSIYWPHYYDATLAGQGVAFTANLTAASTSMTSVNTYPAGAALTLQANAATGVPFYYLAFSGTGTDVFTAPFGEKFSAYATTTGSGTATLTKTAANSFTGIRGVSTLSQFHAPYASFQPTNSSVSALSSDEAAPISTSNPTPPGSTSDWIDLAKTFAIAIQTHAMDTSVHQWQTGLLGAFTGFGPNRPYNLALPEVGSFLYAFVYKYTYKTSNGVEFVEYSNPVLKEASDYPINYPVGTVVDGSINLNSFSVQQQLAYGPAPAITNYSFTFQSPTRIVGIPPLTNDSKTHYDLTKIEVQIYRTINAGQTYYLLATLPNGTTTYEDSTNDTLSDTDDPLNDRETLYTTGGVVGFDPLPRAKYCMISNNTAIYGGIYDGEEYFPNRIIQSIPGAPWATNLTFYDDLEEDVTGLSVINGNILAFSATKSYRVSGGFNELGQGALTHEAIAQNVGCISGASIVQTDSGVYFAGNDGFYYSDGYTVVKVSSQIDYTYRAMTASQAQRERIVGTYDRIKRRIYWTMQSTPSGLDCDTLFVLYTNYGEKAKGIFTKWMNGTDFMPSSVVHYRGALIRGDYRGVLYEHTVLSKTDPKVPTDLTTLPEDWMTVAISWWYKSAALDYNSTFRGQWATRIHVMGKNVGNVGLQVATIREDDNQKLRELSPVYWLENIRWGDPTITWGDSDIIWQYDTVMDEWRRFPTKSLRSQFRQVSFKPADIVVYKYDDYPDMSFCTTYDGTTQKRMMMEISPEISTNPAWPGDCDGMFISFDVDDYYKQYLILRTYSAPASRKFILVADPDQTIPGAGDMKWQIKGVVKENRMSLTSYDVHFGFMGQRGQAFKTGEGGGNT